jgi:hypothetical protein
VNITIRISPRGLNMDNNQKYKVISMLQNEHTPKEIADDLDVSYGAVLKLRREYETAKINGTIDTLLDTNKLVLTEVAEQLSDLPTTEDAVIELTKGLNGLERLSEEFQATALTINTRTRSLLLSIEHISELEVATDILCKLQNAFLNKNSTQVNIQNNLGGDSATPKYSQFLGDKPSD